MSDTIVLTGGVEVPVVALQLAWALEARGILLRLEGNELFARPRNLLRRSDIELIKQHRSALKLITAYEAPRL